MPFSVGRTAFWLRERIMQFFATMSGYPWPEAFAALALGGFVALWRQRRDVALVLLGPFLVTLAAAIAQQYPFRARLVLFLLPTLLLSAAAAIGWVVDWLSARRPALGALACVAALIPPIASSVRRPPPYTTEQFKPVLKYVQSHRRDGDRIYIFSNAYQAVARYGPLYGMQPGSYVNGACADSGYRAFYADADQFRGAPRLWVIASSVPDFLPARRALGRYLQTIGVRRDSISLSSVATLSPVSAELYDLSDSVRLGAANAASFQVKADTLAALCFDWIRPTPHDSQGNRR